jgi:D-sedoheptulose 7-phosphate isomerase
MRNNKKVIVDNFTDSINITKKSLEDLSNSIETAAEVICASLKIGCTLITCGNGGSAADAQHLSAELVGRYLMDRKPLPSIALSTNTSSLTAIGNDYGYVKIFERQLMALGKKGDVLVCISTSGNSENVIRAAKLAKKMKIKTIPFTGNDGGLLKRSCDINLIVRSVSTPRIQEVHELIMHTICEIIEKELFGIENKIK